VSASQPCFSCGVDSRNAAKPVALCSLYSLQQQQLTAARACNSLASRIPRNQARSPFKNISLSFIGNVNRLSANQPAFDDDEEIFAAAHP